jgi:hypothetical protein
MILPFSTKINGKETFFVEKIHKGIRENYLLAPVDPSIHYPTDYNFIAKDKLPAKIHTIREDKKNRWKAATKIDFFINARQKNMLRFAPVLPVVSVQKIEIKWYRNSKEKRFWYKDATICIDEVYLNCESCIKLAQNDGFDTIEDFFDYFNEDFTGKIIHWTDLKY